MLTIDQAKAAIRAILAPCDVKFTYGHFQETLTVKVCDAHGNLLDEPLTIPSTLFGDKVALASILYSARERLSSKGYALAPWPADTLEPPHA